MCLCVCQCHLISFSKSSRCVKQGTLGGNCALLPSVTRKKLQKRIERVSNYSNYDPTHWDPTKTSHSYPQELKHTQPPEKPQVQTDAARRPCLHKHNIRHLENKASQECRRVRRRRRRNPGGLACSSLLFRERTSRSGRAA